MTKVTKPSETYIAPRTIKQNILKQRKIESQAFAEKVRKPNIVMGYKDDQLNSTHR